MTLVRIVAPDFVAGVVFEGLTCVRAAPKLRWALHKDRDTLRAYFLKHGWKASIVEDVP